MDCVSKKYKLAVFRKNLPIFAACISLDVFIGLATVFGTAFALTFIPLLCAVPAFAFIIVREKRTGPKPEVVMNESPTAIGMMRLMIDRGRSLDSAVREVAANGPKNIANMFSKVIWDVDTRASTDIRDSLSNMLASLSDKLTAFKRSMYLIISASDSKDAQERMRITKDASDTMLEGLREMGESYSSKLNAPCMAIFGLGVMVPMILVSILPMLSLGGQFSSAALDERTVALITLILIPAVVGAVIMTIASNNPFYVRADEKLNAMTLIPAVVCVLIFFAVHSHTNDLAVSIAVSAIISGTSLFAVLYPGMMAERRKVKIASVMGDALFDVGNRLLSGENFETALVSSFRQRNDCEELTASLEGCITISRGDIADALRTAMGVYSKSIAEMYTDVYISSLKDLRDAGRLAVSMGHQLQDQNATVSGIQNKLRSMLDMMIGTSSIFAPLILGISVSMLAPLMDLAGGSGSSLTSPILMAYLIELALLISVLTTQLRCRGGPLTTLYTFSMIVPVALIVFMITSGISL